MSARVLVGAPCAKFPVFDEFYDCFYALRVPDGSPDRARMRGGSIPLNLNTLVDMLFETDATHLFIVEDDSAFDPNTVNQLVAHDVPVVAGLCRARHAPFMPYIYDQLDPVDGLRSRSLLPEDRGLIKVAATGLGGILIKREVFEKLSRPYFQHFHVGEREWGQDVAFGAALVKAGIDVYCDTDAIIWHATQCVLGSRKMADGRWGVVFRVDNQDIVVHVGGPK